MKEKKMTTVLKKIKLSKNAIGAGLITSGVTAVVCTAFFYFFGDRFFEQVINTFAHEAYQESKDEKKQTAEVDTIAIPGMKSMTIEADSKVVSAELYNPEKNNCYFEISILINEDEEIYKSNLISPGQTLAEIQLNEELEAGNYEAVLHYATYAMNDYTPLNGANVPFELIVQ